jgi:hypothetical protein
MKTSNKLLLGLLILILLASTTLVGLAKYYQTKSIQGRTGGNTGQLYWPKAPLFVYAHAHSHLYLYT